MSSVALSYPKISGRFPPTSGERESFPSEKAPAPAEKMPPGPAPMMITSKCSPDFISQVSFRVSIYGHQDRERSLHTILYRIIVLPDTQDERNENQIIDMGKNTGKIV